MRHFRWYPHTLVLLLCILCGPATASPPRPRPEAILAITESTRAKLMVYLARGDIAGAISMYEAHTDYLARLQARSSISWELVSQP